MIPMDKSAGSKSAPWFGHPRTADQVAGRHLFRVGPADSCCLGSVDPSSAHVKAAQPVTVHDVSENGGDRCHLDLVMAEPHGDVLDLLRFAGCPLGILADSRRSDLTQEIKTKGASATAWMRLGVACYWVAVILALWWIVSILVLDSLRPAG